MKQGLKLLIINVGAVLTLSLVGCANLHWVEPKTYTPAATPIEVNGFGINGPVDILPVGTTSITISHVITNAGSATVPAGYEITETVVQWVFQRLVGSGGVGWTPGDPATHTVIALTQLGPALAPGGSATIVFGPIPVTSCGLFGETMTLDSTSIVSESSEGDNDDLHLFFVPSSQEIDIGITTINGSIFHGAGPILTHEFEITSPSGSQWLYSGFSFIATEGSTARTDPLPAPGVLVGPGPQVVQMFVTPLEHSIPSLGFAPTIKGKITVISEDGCVIRQEVAEVFVEHE